MKKYIVLLIIFFYSYINIAFATLPTKTQLYKELYYGMSKNNIEKYYQFEVDDESPNELYIYNQSFLGFNWDIRLSLDDNNQLESVILVTDPDENGNKLTTLMSAISQNFVTVYAINDNRTIDLFYVLKKNGSQVYLKSTTDFIMESSNSSSLNIISINAEALNSISKMANSYIELLQKIPSETRQAEIIVESYDDGTGILGIEFSAPKMLILKMKNQTIEKF